MFERINIIAETGLLLLCNAVTILFCLWSVNVAAIGIGVTMSLARENRTKK